MFAVVRTGGKQYRVAADQKIIVDRLPGEAGDSIALGDVLLLGDGEGLKAADGQVVSAEIVAQIKGDKIIVFKKKRRHNYRRRNGHRQLQTLLKITAIGEHKADDAPKAEAKPAKAAKSAPAPAETVDAAPAAPVETAAPVVASPEAEAPAKPKRASKPKVAPAADAE